MAKTNDGLRSVAAPFVVDGDTERWNRKALELCTSGQISPVGDSSICIRNWDAGIDEKQYTVLDFSEFWLPTCNLYAAKRLSEDYLLSTATVLSIDAYLSRVEKGKTTSQTAIGILRLLARVWEWGFLHDLYRPSDWTGAHFRKLWKELQAGGWPEALVIRSRTLAAMSEPYNIKELVWPSHSTNGQPSIKQAAVQAWLHTNLARRSLAQVREILLGKAQAEVKESKNNKYSSSLFRMILKELQRVAQLEAPYGFAVDPLVSIGNSASKAGIKSKGTPNLEVETAVRLLESSLRWVYEYSDSILALVQNVLGLMKDAQDMSDYARRKKYRVILDELPAKKVVCDITGVDITLTHGRKPGSIMMHHLVGMLMTAAFIVIAVMNGRRRDEICHPKLGLKTGAIRIVNEELNIYAGTFYLEKGPKTYVDFFVNRSTYAAFEVLERLNKIYVAAEQAVSLPTSAADAASVFWQRSVRMVDGINKSRTWFLFDKSPLGPASKFIRHSLGGGAEATTVASHMFRRFYALIFMYRYENGTLQALAHQFGHLDLGVTRRYVTDASHILDDKRMPVHLFKTSQKNTQAIVSDQKGLGLVIDQVAMEKLGKVVDGLLGDVVFSGGFAKLVRRLHNKFILNVDYFEMDRKGQAGRLTQTLIQKGHSLRPFPHGECTAGNEGKRRAGNCYSIDKGRLDKSVASALTCARCPYHIVSQGYLEAQRSDLRELMREASEFGVDSIHGRRFAQEISNLGAAIALHSSRVERSEKKVN